MIAVGSQPGDVVSIRGLSRSFGRTVALEDVSLDVPRGEVFGLIGPNGAGKTTLIRHVLGTLRARTGSVRVFGLDPVADPVGVLGQVGYLAEDPDLPGWMRVDELLRYTGAFYPNWDSAFAERLRQAFELDPAARVKTLSKGQKARAGLVLALAHRPALLLLDEPSSGLDPIVRRDILGSIVRTIADEGRTVLFSSHLLSEVERVADRVALILRGRIALCGPLDEVKASHRRLTLRFERVVERPPELAGVLAWEGSGREWTATCAGPTEDLAALVSTGAARVVEERVPSLDEIFLARAGSRAVSTPEG